MKGLFRFSYTKIIDAASRKPWEMLVFEDTYLEFFMQAQQIDPSGTHPTFQALLDHVPKADQLHYLTSRAAVGYLKQLDKIIPDVLNAAGDPCLPFTQFKFEIRASDVRQKEAHRVGIYFYSDPLTWIDTVGNHLLFAYGDQRAALREGQEVTTDLIELQPHLSIWSFQSMPGGQPFE